MDYVTITNYPYDPRKFASDGRYGGIKTKETLRLCLFPTQSPQPYWDALGNMKVSRVRDFEYGLPYTEKIPVVKQARMIGGKMVMLEDLRAVKWLQEKAANGDESAQCSLGLRYLKGQGVPKDAKRAREWLGKAAAQGNAEASAALSKLNATPMDSLNVKSEAK